MSKLNVKVGDKGTYRGGGTPCEVVYVMPKGDAFVTQGGLYVPQVHDPDGAVHNKDSKHTFNFIPEPKTVRVGVWVDDEGVPYCALRPVDNSLPRYPEKILTFEVPR